jgi:1-acyl-sn-glycerol-3-phosphate acyltransferase
MGMFPEGGRSQKSLGKAMLGAAMIAIKSGAPVLPVGITGTERAISLVRLAMPTGTFRVRIGEPFKPPPVYSNKLRGNLEKVTDIIMERIAEVLPENYRGLYDGSIGHGHHEYTSPERWGT